MRHMNERIPEPEALKFPIPQSLLPKGESPTFPDLTQDTLMELAEGGWKRIGILALVVNPKGEVLTVTHGESNPKVPAGTRGIVSETLTFTRKNGEVEVEQVDEALSRVFSEELGLTAADIERLNLTTVGKGAWQPVSFPLNSGEFALGLILVLQADEQTAQFMTGQPDGSLIPTKEITHAAFARPESIEMLGRSWEAGGFRPGTSEIIRAGLNLLTVPHVPHRISLPPPKEKETNAHEDLKELLNT